MPGPLPQRSSSVPTSTVAVGMPEQMLRDKNRVKGEEEWPDLCKSLSIFSLLRLAGDNTAYLTHKKMEQSFSDEATRYAVMIREDIYDRCRRGDAPWGLYSRVGEGMGDSESENISHTSVTRISWSMDLVFLMGMCTKAKMPSRAYGL